MQYDQFIELHEFFPMGRYKVNSHQLCDLMSHSGFKGASVRVLHLGTVTLNTDELVERLTEESRPRLDEIKITCLEGLIIIDEPSQNH